MSLRQPVQYPVRYYSYLDAGAPQLADIDGNIKTILKACLVTGYGAKVGAGWTALFEDDYRIVLRRPLLTGNPPDIKIENGVINGTTRHRVVSQDSPIGLDDTNELAAVKMLARDSACNNKWHLIASDFGFIFCYAMAEDGVPYSDKSSVLYVGSMKKMQDSAADFFVASEYSLTTNNGTHGVWVNGILGTLTRFKDMRANITYTKKAYVELNGTELTYNNDYLAQDVIIGEKSITPFYCSVMSTHADLITKTISINDRQMIRYVDHVYEGTSKALYIPLDYWEL